MSKNKRKGLQIKIFVKGFFPKSSAWPNYHNKIMERDQNSLLFWNRSVIELAKNKSRTTKIAYNFTCKDNNDICNSDIQRLLTSAKYLLFLSGDVELNPVPLQSPPMLLLSKRLAELGREVVSIVGDGNCFFRSVSHQLYRTEAHHTQIRALAIQHLVNCPEHFIESNTQQSWLQYLQNMSRLGTWADHIIIQAVANSQSLRINITESADNFSPTTTITSVSTHTNYGNVRDIYIGHVDEIYYVSTKIIDRSMQVFNTTRHQYRLLKRNLNMLRLWMSSL
jgi:hypothetical protein